MAVFLEPQESTPVPILPQTVQADGTFTIHNVIPGNYRIQTGGGPSNSYIKSVHLGGTDVMNGLTLSGPVSESLISENPSSGCACIVDLPLTSTSQISPAEAEIRKGSPRLAFEDFLLPPNPPTHGTTHLVSASRAHPL